MASQSSWEVVQRGLLSTTAKESSLSTLHDETWFLKCANASGSLTLGAFKKRLSGLQSGL